MGFAGQMGSAHDAVALPPQVVQALGKVNTLSALFHVRTALGRSAQKAGRLPPPRLVNTFETGCADDTVLLVSSFRVRALTIVTLWAVPLPLPMLANPRRPRTTFHTSMFVLVPPTLCLLMWTPQMLMTLWTPLRDLIVSATSPLHHSSQTPGNRQTMFRQTCLDKLAQTNSPRQTRLFFSSFLTTQVDTLDYTTHVNRCTLHVVTSVVISSLLLTLRRRRAQR